MRTILKNIVLTLVVVTAGGMTLSAQSRGGDRLPRILDPLGILPTPRQVIRTLDHVARVLPPVVIETRNDPVYDYDFEYRGYPVRDYYGPPHVRYYTAVRPFPVPYDRDYRYDRYEHRSYHPAQNHTYGHGRPVHEGRR